MKDQEMQQTPSSILINKNLTLRHPNSQRVTFNVPLSQKLRTGDQDASFI